jgi:predicted TIM-barrel fold metal-dependent hydrolase
VRVEPSAYPIIDTAVHLWDARTYHRMRGDWLDRRPELKRSWLPADLEGELASCGVRQAVIIEAARDRHELNLWWLELAQLHAFLGPVVAGSKLEQPDLVAWLDAYSRSEHFAGIRTMPAGAPSEWGENPVTARGLAELARRDLCLELLVGWPTPIHICASSSTTAVCRRLPAARRSGRPGRQDSRRWRDGPT